MPLKLDTSNTDFENKFTRFILARREVAEDVDAATLSILTEVRKRGDTAVAEFTAKFDGIRLTPNEFAIEQEQLEESVKCCDPVTIASLQKAADRIRSFHKTLMPQSFEYYDSLGIKLGSRWTPVDAVGLYVPGGTASYPSTVLMTAIPAVVAGVQRIVMVVPTPEGIINPLLLAAARLGGVTEIYRI